MVLGGATADVIEVFAFEDGRELSMADVRAQLFNTLEVSGVNHIDGTQIDPIWAIAPGTGADRVIMDSDTKVVLSQGDGIDTLILPTIMGDARITLTDFVPGAVHVRYAGTQDLLIEVPETGDQIILARARIVSEIPTILFGDGTEWKKADLMVALIKDEASAFDDVITGTNAAEEIEGGTGDDDI